MDTDGGIEVGIRCPHDGGLGAARRQPGDINAGRVDWVVAHDLARNPGDEGWLARVAPLVAGAEPVPAFGRVGGRWLARIGDHEPLGLRPLIHTRSRGEVVGVLGAAVQHDDQRDGSPAATL